METWYLKFASYKEPDDIFNKVEDNSKTIETRPIDIESENNYSKIKKGDRVICISKDSGKRLNRNVTFVHIYDSLKEMFNHEDINLIFPGIKNKDALYDVYEDFKKKWGYNYKNNLEKYGIVAIGLQP